MASRANRWGAGARPGLAWALLAATGTTSACSPATRVQTTPPWPADHTAVVVALDARDQPRTTSLTVLRPGAAGELVLDDDQIEGRLLASTWDPSTPLDGCTFAVGEARAPLPPPTRWITSALDEGTDALAWTTTEQVVPLDATCPARDTQCSGVTVRSVDVGPTYGPLLTVLALDDGAIVGGLDVGPADHTSLLWRLDDDGAVTALTSTLATSVIRSLFVLGGEVQGVTYSGQRFAWTGGSGLVSRGQVGPVDHAFPVEPDRLALLRTTPGPLGTAPTLAEVDGAGRVSERPDAPPGIRVGAVVSRQLEYLATSDGSLHRGDGRGNWRTELSQTAVPDYMAMVATPAVAYVAPQYLGVLRRTADGTWQDIGRSGHGFALAMALLPGDGVLLTSRAGGLARWDGRAWCAIPVPNHLDLVAVSVSPDGRTAWVVGAQDPRTLVPVVLRVALE